VSALKAKILDLIRAEGPITVSQYMQIALYDPHSGYYTTREPLGVPKEAGGDFVTAPEISQVFGELLGLFFVQAWEDRGHPQSFHLVEFGPGRGTMMADMLRAARLRPAFREAARVMVVETSPALRALQKTTLDGENIVWADRVGDIPDDAPLFAVGNEFLDAFPIRQFVRAERGWHERMIAAQGDALVFALSPELAPAQIIPESLRDAAPGSVFETSPAAENTVRQIARRVRETGGVALFIDYGPMHSACGDTLQALKAHRFADPLAEPGLADLTAHVDFAALARVARAEGAEIFGPATQGEFLAALGARERAVRLGTEEIRSVNRLLAQDAMGVLFKAVALCAPGNAPPAGFSLPNG
jgi:SAM-dependent MidA family methyltransferase